MRRGEVWWAQLPPPVGRRPVVLVSRDEAYAIRELVTVVPITTQVRGIPVEVPLGRDEGLPRRSVANTDTLTTRSEEHTSELQSHHDLVCRLLLEKKKNTNIKKVKPSIMCITTPCTQPNTPFEPTRNVSHHIPYTHYTCYVRHCVACYTHRRISTA